ncbi:TraB/GumN family protein [Rhodanobacter umsongensis]
MQGFGKRVLMTALWVVAWEAIVFPAAAIGAADRSISTPHAITLQTVTVTGVQPGPGLWKVSRGDHVLWILGTLDELPGRIHWQAQEVRQRIAQSQQVLATPVVRIHADVGYFDKLAFNPAGRKLQDVVTPDDYAKWLRLKAAYIGDDDSIESHRPIFAAIRLYLAAMEHADLSGTVIGPVITDALKQHHLGLTPVVYRADPVGPPGAVRNFDLAQADDLQCFEKTLDHLEGDVELIRRRANAWALGDLDRLAQLPMSDQLDVCRTVLAESGAMRKLGVAELHANVRAVWVAAASHALETDKVSFALLPMEDLLGPDNYLVALQAQGNQVKLPDGLTPPPVAAAESGAR